jgi:hypothetical protein
MMEYHNRRDPNARGKEEDSYDTSPPSGADAEPDR